MILAGKNTRFENQRTLSSIIFIAVLIIVLGALFFFPQEKQIAPLKESSRIVSLCDAEVIEGDFFITENFLVSGIGTQSDSIAHSGMFSSKINPSMPYGLTALIDKPIVGTHFKASVWMFRTEGQQRGSLIMSAGNSDLFYKENSLPSIKNKDGWELLTGYFTIPDTNIQRMKVYTFAGASNANVYFDDLKVEEIQAFLLPTNNPDLVTDFKITMPEEGFQKLKHKKEAAVRNSILISEDNDWTPAYLQTNEAQDILVMLRLKGDYLDHISEDKWSMRIKVKGQKTFNDLRTFSIQSPHTRSFLREWLYHKMLEEADVLTPRYSFSTIAFDSLKTGVYALEEHFEKQLLENKKRREGPIIKLIEDGFWLGYKRQTDFYGNKLLKERMDNAFWKSDIKPFKESKTLASETLTKQFEIAQNLLFNYKYQSAPVSEIFDIDKLAKLYAIMDINDAYHGRAWHNQRFYYNPVISKLEPIGYDGFGERIDGEGILFLGYYFDHDKEFIDFTYAPFLDAEFYRAYINELNILTQKDTLEKFLEKYRLQIDENEKIIRTEYTDYELDLSPIIEKAQKIQNLIIPLDKISLLARTSKQAGQFKDVQLFNKHCIPLDVIGYGMNEKEISNYFPKPIFVPNQIKGRIPEPKVVKIPAYASVVFFTIPSGDSIYISQISEFSGMRTSFPVQQIIKVLDTSTISFLKIIGKDVIVPKGTHTLEKDLIIQKDQQLIIGPGTTIDFINSANIISYGPVTIQGTPEEPIHFSSSDNTGQSLTVLQAPAKSVVKNTTFNNLKALDKFNWTLTGAVCFYESEVQIENCKISDIQSEDALNIIRANFHIDGLTIQNTSSDGFDADFCTGELRNSIFNNTGNDGMDFSGCNITVGGTKIDHAGDKGISAGEESTVMVWNASIKNSNIGVASKDNSELTIYYIEMTNCTIGYAAYQKKPEFGPAKIIVTNEVIVKNKFPHQIEKGSSLTIGDTKING